MATVSSDWIKGAKVAVPGEDGQLKETVTDIPPGTVIIIPEKK